jgi:Baseplate J-like protein
MALRTYRIDQLIQGAKVIVRAIPGIGTEYAKDTDLTINAAARLLHGVQVAATHVYQQLVPETADATRRDEMAAELGLSFTREACPARGLLAVTLPSDVSPFPFTLGAGSLLTLPGASFPDGVERTFRLLEDLRLRTYTLPDAAFSVGTGIHKLMPKTNDGVQPYADRDLLTVKADAGTTTQFAVVRTVNSDDASLDLHTSVQGFMTPAAGNVISQLVHGVVVSAECTVPGAVGNAPRVRVALQDVPTQTVIPGLTNPLDLVVLLVEMSGGGDAQSDVDSDTARMTRLIADTLACPPGHGNLQHWRELALQCPDVDLDDAVVYQHVRGPGTVDIVAIGRSGSVESSAFPGTHLGYVFGGNNQRVIGDVQAKRVEDWVRSKAGYFDDIRVRSMEWDWRGNSYYDGSLQSFVQSSSGLVVTVDARDGFGPDCGVALDYTPDLADRDSRDLRPDSVTGVVDASLRPGHRVWVAVGPATGDIRHALATVVTPILSVAGDRTAVTIADVAALLPGLHDEYGGKLVAVRWGSAGPLTQPVLDASYAYYDQLGPGSYTEPPLGPGYARNFGSTAPAVPGAGVTRWPPESMRWSSSMRESELRARLMAIPGVDGATISAMGDIGLKIADFEPSVFRTLALTAAVVRYRS